MPRRACGILLACTAAAAGCSDTGGRQRTEAVAATLAPSAAGYEAVAATTTTHERSVLARAESWEAGGLRLVRVVDASRLYRNADGGALVLRSTPAVRASDRSSLPSARPQRLVTLVASPFADRLPDLRPARRAGTWRSRLLGQPVEVATFVPNAGDDWRVHTARRGSRDDIVVAVLLAPAATPRSAVDAVLTAVEHGPAREPSEAGAVEAPARADAG